MAKEATKPQTKHANRMTLQECTHIKLYSSVARTSYRAAFPHQCSQWNAVLSYLYAVV